MRSISFVGCFLSSFGVALCYLADKNIGIIIAGIGVIQGFGIGLTYVQNNAIINQYFVKYRATANGISLSGGTIGAFLISLVLESSLRRYELRDCFLILSGMTLLTLPFCLLLKPFRSKDQVTEDGMMSVAAKHVMHSLSRSASVMSGRLSVISANQYYASNIQNSILNTVSLTSGIYLKSYSKIKEDPYPDALPDAFRNHPQPILSYPTPSPAAAVNSISRLTSMTEAVSTRASQSHPTDSFATSVTRLMGDPMFLLIAVTHMSYFWASITYCMIVVDFAQDKGISVSDGLDLITAFSVGDLIGRLGSGFAMDKKVIPLKYVAMICSLGIGVLMNSAIIVHGYWLFILISGGLGFLSGVINVLLNQLFCKYVGSDKAALAFGVSAFLSGVVTTVRPIVVGSFRDQKDGSYDGLLITLGLTCVVTGLLWFLEPVIAVRRQEKRNQHLLPEPPGTPVTKPHTFDPGTGTG